MQLSQSPTEKAEADKSKEKKQWGIFTYYYNDKKCDYERSKTLTLGQNVYRSRKDQDAAKIFVAQGEVTRQKGDQVAIEICTGQALADGNLKMKTFGEGEKFFVVNHETNTIYNDVVEFDKSRLDQAVKSYNSFP